MKASYSKANSTAYEQTITTDYCHVFWGSHGCSKRRFHAGNRHKCDPCKARIFHALAQLFGFHKSCVERWPYYFGTRKTNFYGEDIGHYGLTNEWE